MFRYFCRFIDRLIGVADASGREQALVEERFHALQRQIPWLYAILLVNLLGLNLSLTATEDLLRSPATFLSAAVLVRLIYWVRMRAKKLPPEKIKQELRKTFVITALFCLSYCCWSLSRYAYGVGEDQTHIVLFASLAAIGCSYGLSSFPAAGRLPLLLLALPLALRMMATDDAAHIGMGFSLMMLVFVTLRLLDVHNGVFARLVYSRFDVETERSRARAAERVAKEEKSRVRQIADTDPLTGVANRRAFLAQVEATVHRGETDVAVALLDLDGFKPINDTFGHETGDRLLVEVSRRLQSAVGASGSVARLGGDEFALLYRCDGEAGARSLCDEAVRRIGIPFDIGQRMLSISACGGISFNGRAGADLRQSIRQADIALYSAKRRGRANVELFSPEMEAPLQRRTAIEQALREPGVQNSIELAFQPILHLQTMELRSFEALARWRHSELGWIAPSEFIPITERISVVERISDALLAQAAAEARRWPDSVRLSFNVSGVQISSLSSAEKIIDIIADAGLEPARLQIEVTETAFLADFDVARQNLSYLRDRGVRIVLDDFGEGFASISYLREMNFDAVKLDGSLIRSADFGGSGLPLLRGVLDLCGAVGLPCVAEHVETERQLSMLLALGCRYGQGFGLAAPMDADAAARLATSSVIPFARVERGREAA